jgi:hypothetical protein
MGLNYKPNYDHLNLKQSQARKEADNFNAIPLKIANY